MPVAHSLRANDERDPAERLSSDDLATRREAEFLAQALQVQAANAYRVRARPGLCTNCGDACAPLAVYCDEECRGDHEGRVARQARTGVAR
jgi:hypothetical protein